MGQVYKLSVNVVTQGSAISTYLYQFPNNVGIALVYIALFKLANICNLTDYLTIATAFNSIIVAMSGILMYAITKKMFGNKKAMMLSIILLFTTPLYLYSAIYYTDTLSMFMSLLIVYIFLIVKSKNNKLKKTLGYILLGVLIFIGIKIKITVSFIIIAYIVYIILNGQVKQNLRGAIPIICSIIVMAIIYNIGVNKFVLKKDEITDEIKLPIEHWIVMGLEGNGGYNEEEYVYISQFPTYEQKKIAAREKIKEMISNYDVNTFIKHLNSKLKYAWTDGTYFAPEKLRREPVNETILHEFVLASGKYVRYYKYIPQIMHMSMLIFILIGVIKSIKNNEVKDKNIILYILMLGYMLFLLIWENRSRYILTGLPFFIIAQLSGLEAITKSKDVKIKNRGVK